MYKRYCDRCHKEIVREMHEGAFKLQQTTRAMPAHYYDRDIDLCDPCMRSLDEWLLQPIAPPEPKKGFWARMGL